MNKRYILLFVGIVIFFLIFVIVIFSQQKNDASVPTPASLHSQNPAAIQKTPQTQTETTVPTVTIAPLASSPREVARQFYSYYFATQKNPLADGAYKDNPYLAPYFKDAIGALYNNGNASVFCLQNKRLNITVGKEEDIYYDNQYLKQEIISDATGSRDLYRVVLQQVNNKWLVFDVTCIY